ncbi:hypothetical protein FB567DRAFT_87995 [Paraphoma chrysanthemicola]|uniref:B-block binding subunit of TFIIIC domain-containing protein n=1 Tax=Paraphoma chrysanthemicola TaxID=798071 RepID=A0A8K0R1D1_9PLEO|nr:hypothetical protein FB567DRAFT_87995 [Paraphoma chrysanthemicola]
MKMAVGLDELVDHLLSEIALCGNQGAGSADFHRFIRDFYENSHGVDSCDKPRPSLPQAGLGRRFYESVWSWTTTHSDIRIVHGGQTHHYSLAEFEAAESHETDQRVVPDQPINTQLDSQSKALIRPPQRLIDLRVKLRQRLEAEGHHSKCRPTQSVIASPTSPPHLPSHRNLKGSEIHVAVFDEPSSTATAPRLYASQNRVWQALTGHSMDLKKVPTMEFALLSLIAASGATGITQPELTQFSGQDKRSVPHRTDELARKGYIVKNPVQAGKARTSICVHSKFITHNHFTSSGAVEDVFQVGKFVASGFIPLLYSKLKDAGIVPTREIRKRLGVPIRTWNKRAVQGCLIRLDQSGLIKRFRVRKKEREDSWVICIQVQREPRPEDLENLGFRRQATIVDTSHELLQDDGDGDTLMRDLELDMLDDGGEDDEANELDEDSRIPPQWTPDRLLANIIYDFTALGGVVGWDALVLRDRVVGPFWRRPMESQLTRLTDDWERMQPPQVRHLAIIRDTRSTAEKRFIHYVYRAYKHFQQAVDAGEALWEGVRKPPTKNQSAQGREKNPTEDEIVLDTWGFSALNHKDFIRFNGTATLPDVRSAIVGPRKYGPRWDNALVEEIGHRKSEKLVPKIKEQRRAKKASIDVNPNQGGEGAIDEAIEKPRSSKSNGTHVTKKKGSGLTLTPEERVALGLKPTGRLSKSAAQQILAHRRETGDSTSLPATIVAEPAVRGRAPLMTEEERQREGLPPKGRLGIAKENEIRERRGLSKLVPKAKKKSAKKEAAILTKQQRVALGFKEHGRLHQHFVDALRREQEDDIPLEESPAVEAYRAFLRDGATKAAKPKIASSGAAQTTPVEDPLPCPPETQQEDSSVSTPVENDVHSFTSTSNGMKRKAVVCEVSAPDAKRRRSDSGEAHVGKPATAENDDHREVIEPTSQSQDLAVSSSREPALSVTDDSHDSLDITKVLLPVVAAEVSSSGSEPLSPGQEKHDSSQKVLRYSPGLYVYPSAKIKSARGRPRNAFIAIFTSTRLMEMPWFENNGSPNVQIASLGSLRSAGLGLKTQFGVDRDHVARPNADRRSSLPYFSAGDATPLMARAENRSLNQVVPQEYGEIGTVMNGVISYREGLHPPGVGDLASGDTAQDAGISSSLPAVAGSSAIMRQSQHAPTYQSPYASHVLPGSVAIAESVHVTTPAGHNLSRDGSSEAEAHTATSLPQGVVGAIADCVSNVTPKKTAGRSSGPGITGSALRFRREIIQEIIDRCGGVFPLHGEIWRPFSALWNQRHGHTNMKKPESTTVFTTLQNMIVNPAFGLKRMAFLVKARNAAGARERVMVARADMTPSDPRVRRLAYHMANDAMEKSRQYFPEEIRDVFEFETLYVPVPIAPKVDSITLENLGISIQENAARRRREKNEQKKREKEAARQQNEQVEQALPRRRARALALSNQQVPRAKRARLASLNDRNKRYRRAAVQTSVLHDMEDDEGGKPVETAIREPSPAVSDSSDDVPLMSLQPLLTDIVEYDPVDDEPKLVEDEEDVSDQDPERHEEEQATHASGSSPLHTDDISFTHPIVRFEPVTGTYSTNFNTISVSDDNAAPMPVPDKVKSSRTKKRVRLDAPAKSPPRKKALSSRSTRHEKLDDEFVYSSADDSDATSSEDEEEMVNDVRPNGKQRKRKIATPKPKLGKKLPTPTLLERLTGLTGNPEDPIYTDPKQRPRPGHARPWAERKKKQLNKQRKEREYADTLDRVDDFKRLFYTLALASSMSGEVDRVAWIIVEKVYSRDKFFNLSRAKKIWTWMQVHMSKQVGEVVATLQTNMLSAYEAGRLPPIEDPEAYDWAGLVRWTMRTCLYPDIPLPVHQKALVMLAVDESKYAALDRAHWYGKKIADTTRTQLQLQTSFVSPIHRSAIQEAPINLNELKARSWIRANIATPQARYHSKEAHEKLKVLGEDLLTRVVADYVQQDHLKMRKIKRQLPGRNYTFTKKLATKYKRAFELEDFMVGATIKKELDSAFSNDNPEKRSYNISRSEEDGAIMTIMSLVSDGKVKLVPRLPPVKNEFGAPLPRLSKWGFCEGDYIHRAIDRNRMFWDVCVVPTATYRFGNPFQPLSSPSAEWPLLPSPLLPGDNDPDALLPIWSSIHGETVTWPWWYRAMNLVLQPLFVQPGATASDIHSHCDEHVIELFEVELVLNWLEGMGAVSKVIGDGYRVTSNFWASFGDRLLDTTDDWFGENVKRRTKSTSKQRWRDEYNLRYSTMRMRDPQQVQVGNQGIVGDDIAPQLSQQIFMNSKGQYSIMQQALLKPSPGTVRETGDAELLQSANISQADAPGAITADTFHNASHSRDSPPQAVDCAGNGKRDVSMEDEEMEAEERSDNVDAEGDVDMDAHFGINEDHPTN